MTGPKVGDGIAVVEAPDSSEHEALLQFMYMAPVGLVQIAADGQIVMMNPIAVSLLMPLAPTRALDNLFIALGDLWPELAEIAGSYEGTAGEICEPPLFVVPTGARADDGGLPTRTLSVNVLKLDPTRMMAVLRDATSDATRERRALTSGLERASRIDNLTQMPNRAALRDYLQFGLDRTAVPYQRFCAVLFLNCDRFKQINDGLGYAAGDEVLGLIGKRVESVLRHSVRTRSTESRQPIAARLGGDEFAVVLDDLSQGEDVHAVAQRLLDALDQPFGLRTHQLQCNVSMGIVMRAQFFGDADSILQDASIAMVEAKRAGGARYVMFRPEMRSRAQERRELEEDLRVALSERQLFVVYQPVIGFARNVEGATSVDRNVGIEALVRWQHPRRGLVAPLDFISVAEECGLIGMLGQQVLETACRQFVEWRATLGDCAPRTLAVNLSRAQLTQPGFVESVSNTLASAGMAASDLQLEITESLAAQDETIQTHLHALKALGLTLALDDFGTGYSSLSSLHLLPVDTVKIDRSFVNEAVTSAHHRVLIEATIRVAASLSMDTVAEGIETAAQSELLCKLGCDKGQGYLFSRPLTAAQFAVWAAGAEATC